MFSKSTQCEMSFKEKVCAEQHDHLEPYRRCILFCIVGGIALAFIFASLGSVPGELRDAGLGHLLDASKLPLAIGTLRVGSQKIIVISALGLAEEIQHSQGSIQHLYLPFQYLALFIFLALSFGKALLGIICRNPRMTSTGFIDFFTAFIVFGLAWLVVMPFVLYFGAG